MCRGFSFTRIIAAIGSAIALLQTMPRPKVVQRVFNEVWLCDLFELEDLAKWSDGLIRVDGDEEMRRMTKNWVKRGVKRAMENPDEQERDATLVCFYFAICHIFNSIF